MKKVVISILTVLATAFCCIACDKSKDSSDGYESASQTVSESVSYEETSSPESESPSDVSSDSEETSEDSQSSSDTTSETTSESTSESSDSTPDESDESDESDSEGDTSSDEDSTTPGGGTQVPGDDVTDIPEDSTEDEEYEPIVDDGTGVYTVDMTKATKVKNVTDHGYYVDGCPTTGTVKVLVIPVEFSDVTAESKGYTIDKLKAVFNGGDGIAYSSVADYYNISSNGQLNLEFVVLDYWFQPKRDSDYYKKATMNYYGDLMAIGDQRVMNEVLNELEDTMDLTEFDSDNNGVIDAVVMINTLEIDSSNEFNWAYRYWNYYTDKSGNFYEYDGVVANDYIWASYQFIFRVCNKKGYFSYDYNTINSHTYIHEFAHVLGSEDYYDTAYVDKPLAGYDVMDSRLGDHNPFTKFNYGWLTTARLITAEESVTLTLESFTETGDAVIIANNWNEKLGAYQEYYIVVYYTNTGLNSGIGGYFADEGIVVYHINAELTSEEFEGEITYNLKYNNTDASDMYGSEYNLIELVKSEGRNYVYEAGDSVPATEKTDDGQKIAYVFTVDSITEEGAVVTFRKNN